ncbi:MAG: hypothetical protein P8048_09335, partial [Calditrichia bacterium]
NLEPVYRALHLQPGRYWDISLISSKNKKLDINLGENRVERVRDLTGKWFEINSLRMAVCWNWIFKNRCGPNMGTPPGRQLKRCPGKAARN